MRNQEQSYYAGAAFLLLLLQLTQTLLSLHTQAVLGTNCHRNVTEPKLQRDCASNPASLLCKNPFLSPRHKSQL